MTITEAAELVRKVDITLHHLIFKPPPQRHLGPEIYDNPYISTEDILAFYNHDTKTFDMLAFIDKFFPDIVPDTYRVKVWEEPWNRLQARLRHGEEIDVCLFFLNEIDSKFIQRYNDVVAQELKIPQETILDKNGQNMNLMVGLFTEAMAAAGSNYVFFNDKTKRLYWNQESLKKFTRHEAHSIYWLFENWAYRQYQFFRLGAELASFARNQDSQPRIQTQNGSISLVDFIKEANLADDDISGIDFLLGKKETAVSKTVIDEKKEFLFRKLGIPENARKDIEGLSLTELYFCFALAKMELPIDPEESGTSPASLLSCEWVSFKNTISLGERFLMGLLLYQLPKNGYPELNKNFERFQKNFVRKRMGIQDYYLRYHDAYKRMIFTQLETVPKNSGQYEIKNLEFLVQQIYGQLPGLWNLGVTHEPASGMTQYLRSTNVKEAMTKFLTRREAGTQEEYILREIEMARKTKKTYDLCEACCELAQIPAFAGEFPKISKNILSIGALIQTKPFSYYTGADDKNGGYIPNKIEQALQMERVDQTDSLSFEARLWGAWAKQWALRVLFYDKSGEKRPGTGIPGKDPWRQFREKTAAVDWEELIVGTPVPPDMDMTMLYDLVIANIGSRKIRLTRFYRRYRKIIPEDYRFFLRRMNHLFKTAKLSK
jgi:hypothetical protein